MSPVNGKRDWLIRWRPGGRGGCCQSGNRRLGLQYAKVARYRYWAEQLLENSWWWLRKSGCMVPVRGRVLITSQQERQGDQGQRQTRILSTIAKGEVKVVGNSLGISALTCRSFSQLRDSILGWSFPMVTGTCYLLAANCRDHLLSGNFDQTDCVFSCSSRSWSNVWTSERCRTSKASHLRPSRSACPARNADVR